MPKEAISRGAVNVVVPLEQIASAALSLQRLDRQDERRATETMMKTKKFLRDVLTNPLS